MTPTASLEQVLGGVFDECQDREGLDPAEYARRRQEFIFHMTDVQSDFQRVAELYKHPGEQTPDAERAFIIGFLYHVVPHLKAAGRLLLDEVPDPFIGADHSIKAD